jgi:nucleoside-diphosphate-sugar epimerase
MTTNSKTLLITGSSGFVGQRLANKASSLGFKVIGIDIKTDVNKSWESHELSITEADFSHLIPEDSVVIHLASLSTDTACKNDPQLAININYVGTLNTIKCANQAGAKHLIFASSEWVYPERTEITEQNESDILDLEDLQSFYAITKLVGESIVRTESKVPFTNLRFGIVYGPRQIPGSSLEALALKVHNNEDITVGSDLTARRFIYIDDLIDGILKCAILNTKEISNKAVNLTGNKIISLRDIIEVTNKLLGKKSQILTESKSPSIRNPLNNYAKTLLKWDPSTPLEAGIQYCLTEMTRYGRE